MRNRKWIRWLCLALAFCLTAGTIIGVSANIFAGDMDGDGKITAFDAQIAAEGKAGLRDLTDTQKQISNSMTVGQLIAYILNPPSPDSGDWDHDGVIEIYTAAGLQILRNYPSGNFILMDDFDLQGADWVPLSGFTGTLNGNGHTISNFTITTGAPSALNADSAKFNMGFFGDLHFGATVTDLHLKGVTLVANNDAQYIGLLAGSARGQIDNCTVEGLIVDARETHNLQTFIGILVGRIPNASQGETTGNVAGGTSISVTDQQGRQETTGLCGNVALQIADKDGVNIIGGKSQKIGVVGFAPGGAAVSGIWCDSSNSSSLLDEDLQNRQQIATDYMNTMGTVLWTPSETMTYIKGDGTKSVYKVGTVYRGIPYNHKNGSYERFLSVMASQDENGVYTPVTGLGDSLYETRTMTNANGDSIAYGGYDGFVKYMGNDCSTAVTWAWRQISPIRINVTTDTYAGGAYPSRTRYMVPNDENRQTYGIYPIGNWTTSNYNAEKGTWTAVEYDPALAAYTVTDERSTEDILANNGRDTILEAYAQAHRGDAIVSHRATPNEEGIYNHSGHCRMLTADPVIIRNVNGTIDENLSYVVSTEQGSPDSGDGWTSSWKVNYVRNFELLLQNTPDVSPNPAGPYLPVTIRALKDEAVRAPYMSKAVALSGPVTGKFYSNYGFISMTVTVMNGFVTVLFENESFTGINFQDGIARSDCSMVDLNELCAESFYASANGVLKSNHTYYYTVTATFSNGEQVNLNLKFLNEARSAFTYTPAE